MKPAYQPRHFKTQELVTPYAFDKLGDGALILLDDRILRALDAVRDIFDVPITVNNWHIGGGFDQRGWRDDSDTGAKFSQHRFGRAIDFDVQGLDADYVRQVIATAWQSDRDIQQITRMEVGITWCHVDCAPIDRGNGIFTFKP